MKTINVAGEPLGERVVQAHDLKVQLDELTQKLDELRELFRKEGIEYVTADDKSIKFQGDGAYVKVTYPEPIIKLVQSKIDELRDALGEDFESVVTVEYKVKDAEKLRAILGQAGNGFRTRLASCIQEVPATARVTIE